METENKPDREHLSELPETGKENLGNESTKEKRNPGLKPERKPGEPQDESGAV